MIMESRAKGSASRDFKSWQRGIIRIVALRLIGKERLSSPKAARRFRREGLLVAQLSHPNIVHAFDAGQAGDTHYFTMEYVVGSDLAQRVRTGGPVPAREACGYVRQAARGLPHGPQCGLVPRDNKP